MRFTTDPFPIVHRDGRDCQVAVCACGAEHVNSIHAGRASPETLAHKLSKIGWNIDLRRRHFLCPSCVQAQIAARRAEKLERQNMSKSRTDQTLPSEESVFAKQLMMELLSKGYDLKARNYAPGWSDKRIAEECKLSAEFVAKRREEDFGPAPPPPPPILVEIAQRLEALEKLSQMHAEQTESLYGLICNLRSAAKNFPAQYLSLREAIAKATEQRSP